MASYAVIDHITYIIRFISPLYTNQSSTLLSHNADLLASTTIRSYLDNKICECKI